MNARAVGRNTFTRKRYRSLLSFLRGWSFTSVEFYVDRETRRWRFTSVDTSLEKHTSLEKRVGGKQTLLENHVAILREVSLIIKETRTKIFYYLSFIVQRVSIKVPQFNAKY